MASSLRRSAASLVGASCEVAGASTSSSLRYMAIFGASNHVIGRVNGQYWVWGTRDPRSASVNRKKSLAIIGADQAARRHAGAASVASARAPGAPGAPKPSRTPRRLRICPASDRPDPVVSPPPSPSHRSRPPSPTGADRCRRIGGGVPPLWGLKSPYSPGTEFLGVPRRVGGAGGKRQGGLQRSAHDRHPVARSSPPGGRSLHHGSVTTRGWMDRASVFCPSVLVPRPSSHPNSPPGPCHSRSDHQERVRTRPLSPDVTALGSAVKPHYRFPVTASRGGAPGGGAGGGGASLPLPLSMPLQALVPRPRPPGLRSMPRPPPSPAPLV